MAIIKPLELKLSSGEIVYIRPAEESDALEIIKYLKEVLSASKVMLSQEHEISPTIEGNISWIKNSSDSPNKLILLAIHNSNIIGMIDFKNGHRERNSHTGNFAMSVQKHWRGRGIGKALLTSLLNWAEVNDCIEKVCLSVFANNHIALNLYKNFGFKEEGRRPRSYKLFPGKYVDEIMMYKFVTKFNE